MSCLRNCVRTVLLSLAAQSRTRTESSRGSWTRTETRLSFGSRCCGTTRTKLPEVLACAAQQFIQADAASRRGLIQAFGLRTTLEFVQPAMNELLAPITQRYSEVMRRVLRHYRDTATVKVRGQTYAGHGIDELIAGWCTNASICS